MTHLPRPGDDEDVATSSSLPTPSRDAHPQAVDHSRGYSTGFPCKLRLQPKCATPSLGSTANRVQVVLPQQGPSGFLLWSFSFTTG